VSPSLRESLRIGLCPDRVAYMRYSRGVRPRLLDRGTLGVEGGIAEEPWRPALDTLSKVLQSQGARSASAVMVLSNHFVRYVLLGADKRISSREEWLEYASHCFEKTYGERARGWDIRVAESAAERPRLASAIDRALLEAIAASFKTVRASLGSIRPHLMVAFNRALPLMNRGSSWFVVQEPGQLLLGLLRDGLWRSVRGRRADTGWHEELPQIVDRENALLAPEEPCRDVFVAALEPAEPGERGGYRFAAPAAAADQGIYAMVCS
jgi:hypothetical protein